MSSKITEITKAIESYLTDAILTLPVIVSKIQASPVAFVPSEQQRNPQIYINPIATTKINDTRDSYRYEYQVDVVVVDFLQVGTDLEIEDLEFLVSELEKLLRNLPQAGTEFVSFNNESERDEFEIPQVDTGAYFVSTISLTYVDFE